MKVPQEIIDRAISKGVYDKINWKRTVYIKWKLPKPIKEAVQKNEWVIIGDGEVKDFYNPFLFTSPVDDELARLVSVNIPKNKIRKLVKEGS